MCKDDNEQLMTQYEREKHLRKSAEQVLLHVCPSCYSYTNCRVLPKPQGPSGGYRPGISLHSETTGLVHHAVCLFMP